MEPVELGELVLSCSTGADNSSPSVSASNLCPSSAPPSTDPGCGLRHNEDSEQVVRDRLTVSSPPQCSSTSSVPDLGESLQVVELLHRVRKSLGSVNQVSGQHLDKALSKCVSVRLENCLDLIPSESRSTVIRHTSTPNTSQTGPSPISTPSITPFSPAHLSPRTPDNTPESSPSRETAHSLKNVNLINLEDESPENNSVFEELESCHRPEVSDSPLFDEVVPPSNLNPPLLLPPRFPPLLRTRSLPLSLSFPLQSLLRSP